MSAVAIIQARMGSSRFPGKVLQSVLGRPMLARQVERIASVPEVEQIIVATSNLPRDDVLAEACKAHRVACFRGDEIDVLDRFYRAAREYESDPVLRFTADCPLIDPGLVSRLIQTFRRERYDHAGIAAGAGVSGRDGIKRYPRGLDAEIMRFVALETAWREARDPFEREHVTPYLWRRPERFRIGTLQAEADLGNYRLTVDFPEDLALVRAVYEELHPSDPEFGFGDILDLLEARPDLVALNRAHVDGNVEAK